jgi:hypothetical protein
MINEYRTPEVLEIGKAEEVILGVKPEGSVDFEDGHQLDSNLDD